MHDTDTNPTSSQQSARQDTAFTSLSHDGASGAAIASATQIRAKKPGLFQRLLQLFTGLFKRKIVVAPLHDPIVTERAATARAAQLPPPMAFKGDTANTIATPMGTYAGKPVEQALRKRAEQLLKNMDITQTTMH